MAIELCTGGGEQYLPFARSRIRALKALGRPNASQQFEMGDATVRVRLAGGHEFISISGGLSALSGVVRDGTFVELPPKAGGTPVKAVRDFKPTDEAWRYVLKSDVAMKDFHDEPRLVAKTHIDVAKTTANLDEPQVRNVCSSMYSGLMAKAVQIILGLGKSGSNTGAVQVRYDSRWSWCNGITLSADKKPWLVEISLDNGVMVTPLALRTGGDQKQKLIAAAVKLFKGVPAGTPFPSGEKLAAAIKDGTVLLLLKPAEMLPFFSKQRFSSLLGWTFSDDGGLAYNTCFDQDGDAVTSYLYKLAITIAAINPERKDGEPLTTATAALTLVEHGRLQAHDSVPVMQYFEPGREYFAFTGVLNDRPAMIEIPLERISYQEFLPLAKAPLLACHIKGELEVVYLDGSLPPGTTVVGAPNIPSQVTSDVHGIYPVNIPPDPPRVTIAEAIAAHQPLPNDTLGRWKEYSNPRGARTISTTSRPTLPASVVKEYDRRLAYMYEWPPGAQWEDRFLYASETLTTTEFNPTTYGVWSDRVRDGFTLVVSNEKVTDYWGQVLAIYLGWWLDVDGQLWIWGPPYPAGTVRHEEVKGSVAYDTEFHRGTRFDWGYALIKPRKHYPYKTYVVTPDKTITAELEIDGDTINYRRYMWIYPSLTINGYTLDSYNVTCSMLGTTDEATGLQTDPHISYSQLTGVLVVQGEVPTNAVPKYSHIGSLLAAEPDKTDHQYSFIGYLE